MRKLLTICLLLWALAISNAQEVVIKKKQPFTFATMELATKNSVKTTKFIRIKEEIYYLYKGGKGGYFYITKNSKGEFKKNYIKIE